MSGFHSIKVSKIIRETSDCVSIEFEIPASLKSEFQYKHGQYLTFKINKNGKEYRRSYSLCSSPYNGELLKVAVKEVNNGVFSTFANRELKPGDVLETMKPAGNFYTELNASNRKKYVGFAAGSGITPLLSIVKSVLLSEPKSEFHLLYGNKNSNSVIFKTELDNLIRTNANLKITYVYSREGGKDVLTTGRIDENKCNDYLLKNELQKADEYFICGPEEMIMSVNESLKKNNIDKNKIHFELFTTPVKLKSENTTNVEAAFDGNCMVTVLMYGTETQFNLNTKGDNILDAAIDAGIDAPFSCKGAVCCTCKAKIIEGKASMEMNYALSDEEVKTGYILTCQAHPQSAKLVLDYDV